MNTASHTAQSPGALLLRSMNIPDSMLNRAQLCRSSTPTLRVSFQLIGSEPAETATARVCT